MKSKKKFALRFAVLFAVGYIFWFLATAIFLDDDTIEIIPPPPPVEGK